jgi:hypothetical protein
MYCVAHVDDSSQHEKYTLACALVGDQDVWNRVYNEWVDVLDAAPVIGYFTSKDWRNRKGEFAQFNDTTKYPEPTGREAADRKRNELKKIIESSSLQAIVVAVFLPEYERVKARYPNEVARYFGKGPFEAAFLSLMFECGKEIVKFPEHSGLVFLCDEDQNAPQHVQLYLGFKEKNPRTAKILAGIGHMDDRWNPGIQAADLVASVANMLLYDYLEEGKFPDPIPQMDSTFYRVAAFREDYALGLLKHNGVSVPEIEDEKEE